MRFYLDEDLSDRIAALARSLGVAVLSSHECGRDGLDDEAQLLAAAEDGSCLVTRNRSDFVAWTVRFFEREAPHSGVLLLPESLPPDQFAAIAHALVEYEVQYPEGLPPYTVDFLRPAQRRQGKGAYRLSDNVSCRCPGSSA